MFLLILSYTGYGMSDTCNYEHRISQDVFISKVARFKKDFDAARSYQSLSICDKLDIIRILNTIKISDSLLNISYYTSVYKALSKGWFDLIAKDLDFVIETSASYRRFYSQKFDLYFGGPLNSNSFFDIY
jgi:hypothetical protein